MSYDHTTSPNIESQFHIRSEYNLHNHNENKQTDTPKIRADTIRLQTKWGSSKADLQRLTKLKQTTHAHRLPIHKNKAGGQPNDYWGLV